ncbi:MAG: hypothetical protein IKL48_06160 [Elusimicrobiaceae bacterium]|nr:hypothetical protein [Elusimicrobiaceae bacterium]
MAENKKDSFTFSDKIKNSKPAFNPFSKRVSSKVGNNGKPKKTLFERTRRDAPFFVAAAAALLMLPFLYKYSGSVEDGAIITPGTDSVFEPDRSGFDPSIEDPSAQIAQLSVRDPLSLIKGWGDPEPAPSMGSYDRDGLDDTYTPPTPRSSYRDNYRSQRPSSTRASFQRSTPAPTKVNPLGSASMNFRGGGGGFGRFGGANLKTAAKVSSAPAPKAGVKPVSLQPLRSAGNPSRSYFGQGSAAQARASRDAMGKANALQALNDAMYDPLKANQAPLGGLGGGDFVGGAGAGKWDPHSEYKGITPWWWDMMKQQEMEKWKWEYFLWRKGLVEPLIKGLADMTLKFVDPFLSCLITATDDWSMGSMGGRSASGGAPGKCNLYDGDTGYTMAEWCEKFKNNSSHASHYAETCASEENFKSACITGKIGGASVEQAKNNDNEVDANTWDEPAPATGKLSWFGNRRKCLTGYAGKMETAFTGTDTQVLEAYNCEQMANHTFVLKPGAKYSEDEGYDEAFHIVIAKNVQINGKRLCEAEKIDAGFSVVGLDSGDAGKGAASVKKSDAKVMHTSKDNATNDHFRVQNGQKGMYNTRLSEHKYANECVIYLAEGKTFNHDNYKFLLEEAQKSVVVDETDKNLHRGVGSSNGSVYSTTTVKNPKGVNWNDQQIGQFKDKLIPVAIEGYVMKKNPFDGMRKMRKALPMMYKDFIANYIEGQDGDSALCDWTDFNITAKNIVNLRDIHAVLAYDPEVYGNKPEEKITVTVEIVGDGLTPPIQVAAARTHSTEEDNGAGASVFRAPLNQAQLDALTAYFADATAEAPKTIVAKWLAKEKDQESRDTAEYSSTIPNVEMTDVPPGINPTDPETLTDKTKPYLLLSREVSAISTELEGHRILNVQSGRFEVQKADAAKLFPNLSDDSKDSKQRLNSARLDTRSSNKAAEFMTDVVNGFNALDAGKRKGTFMFDSYNEGIFLAEFVDAMYIAKSVLQKTEVPRAAVCTMVRGVALSSEDTQGKAAGLEMTNTFGAAAIYIGLDSAYYPNQYVKKGNNMVVDPRFSGDPYHWGNYVSCTNGGVYSSVKEQIEAVKVRGQYPLASMVNGKINHIKVEGLSCSPATIVDDNRRTYVETYNDILFANEGKCDQLIGNMPIQDALDYVTRVAELGLNYKPRAVASSGNGSDPGGSNGSSQRGGVSRT